MPQDLKYTLRLWAAVLGTQHSPSRHSLSALARIQVCLAWSMHFCCARFHFASRTAWPYSMSSFPPTTARKEFHDWRQQSAYLADAALFEEIDVNLGGMRVGSRAHVAQTSWNFFSMLGVQPVLGIGFAPDEEVNGTGLGIARTQRPGGDRLRTLATAFRRRSESSRRHHPNRRKPAYRVGVAPPGFDYPGKAVLWKPAAFSPGNNGWGTIARLKPGITWPQARAAFAVEVDACVAETGRNRLFQPASKHDVASGRTRWSGEERLADVHGRGGVGLADCLHECGESLDRPDHRSRRGAVHTLRARGKSRQAGASVAHRVLASLFRCHSGRIGDRILDNLARGKG